MHSAAPAVCSGWLWCVNTLSLSCAVRGRSAVTMTEVESACKGATTAGMTTPALPATSISAERMAPLRAVAPSNTSTVLSPWSWTLMTGSSQEHSGGAWDKDEVLDWQFRWVLTEHFHSLGAAGA